MASFIICRHVARVAAGLAVVAAGTAFAETITISGHFPARNREASYLQRLAIDQFRGRDGAQLSNAIGDALAEARNGSGPHFMLLGDPGARADGVLSGSATSDWEEHRVQLTRNRCVERAEPEPGKKGDGKCTRHEDVPVPCMERTTSLTASLRIVRTRDGAIVYSSTKPRSETISWCPGESPSRSAEATIASMIDDIAGETRGDIAPKGETYKVRYREDRTGLSKPLAEQFKAVLRQTKTDGPGACAGWASIDREQPGQHALLFNMGLCAEERGDYPGAIDLYRQAGAAKHGDDVKVAIGRAQSLIAGAEDEARFRRR